ncbi:hypothetical protein AB0I49_38145 [Streptomyces sp. NPDC050617]|uniref:hypothetical protein n=1 Tax=Streptomyces sp. NPDC050617 TaxID=3154628 RepID=UPI0034214801
MQWKSALATVVMAGAMAGGSTLALAPAAQAAPPKPGCLGARAFCFWYNSNQTGSVAGWDLNTGFRGFQNLADAGKFLTSGNGQGVPVKNNAASATYQFPGNCGGSVDVYFNSGWTGASDNVPACSGVNLVKTKNNNASFYRN